MSAAVMLQGCGSDVGKSLLVVGLCRAYRRRGLRVLPFKPQNMSNNAAACADGGEIGRAQALQARACGVAPCSDMNPVLLKPEGPRISQIAVQGRAWRRVAAGDYHALKPGLLPRVLESFHRLRADCDLVVAEGAGAAAEANLRDGDIANMGFARAAQVPVALVGDIERGGVLAALVGSAALLDEADRALVFGFIVNKFRGDPRLFDGGLALIAQKTGWRALGLVPWLAEADVLPAEDSLALDRPPPPPAASGGRAWRVVVPRLPRIANFDDLDPLRLEPGVEVILAAPGRPLPAADLILLPGSKATLADLAALRAEGWDIDILAHHRQGGRVLGLCGGYQMLGQTIADPLGVEGPPGQAPGLGLLAIDTVLTRTKTVRLVAGRDPVSDAALAGYEIHAGESDGADRARPFLEIEGRPEGAVSADGRVHGSYVHGLFAADGFRRAWLGLAPGAAGPGYDSRVEAAIDAIAEALESHLDLDAILIRARG